MDFYAIDVETAECDPASICQIGIAGYQNGDLAYEWESLIKPDAYFHFDSFNTEIHGITEDMVADAPSLCDVYQEIKKALGGNVVVCHTHFDRTSISRALIFYGLEPISCTWLDSARVARRAWKQFAQKGYGLKNICTFLNYEFGHHNALEDAKAAAHIVISACADHNINVSEWLTRVEQRIAPDSHTRVKQNGDPNGPLAGECIVFTGSLSCHREDAAKKAAATGCSVIDNMNSKVTILVVGDMDARRLAGYQKSSKHRKAERIILDGGNLRIINEEAFWDMITMASQRERLVTLMKDRATNNPE